MYNLSVKHDPYLNIYVDSYILTTPSHCVMIDSGLFGQRELIEEKFRGRENALLCTHGHWDHIGMHKTIADMGARVMANEGDAPYFEDHEWHWRDLFGQFALDFNLPPARRETYLARVGSPMKPEYCVSDGTELTFGEMRFKTIAIPGHSRGSVCYLEENSGALFTGDGLIGAGFFTGTPQYMDARAYLASMERLMEVKCETVYSDHNPPMPGAELKNKAREGYDCAMRIDKCVRDYVSAHAFEQDLSLGEIIKSIGAAEGRGVGAGTCVTALAHLETIENPPECVINCLARYIHGI